MMPWAERDAAAARAVPVPGNDWCLFLDVDGTLLDLADTPDDVEVDESLLPLLERLRDAAGGAVALVSGRTIENVDALLGTRSFPTAGLHGYERRDALGHTHRKPVPVEGLSALREGLRRLVLDDSRLLLEDKGAGFGVHYLRAAEKEQELRRQVADLAAPLAAEFAVVHGRAVIEIKPAAHTKGTAVLAYMQQKPFANRTPVYLGDDITDRDGFAAVGRYDGLAIAVGRRVRSTWWLPGPDAVRCWLERLADSWT